MYYVNNFKSSSQTTELSILQNYNIKIRLNVRGRDRSNDG